MFLFILTMRSDDILNNIIWKGSYSCNVLHDDKKIKVLRYQNVSYDAYEGINSPSSVYT